MLKPLTGHASPETAYLIEDYPYSFTLRCKKRVWLEYNPKKGFRFCSQTTNPKKPVEVWNAPKKSTYSMLGVMGINEEGHVTWTGCSIYDFDKLEEFGKLYASSFDEDQRKVFDLATKAYQAYQAKKRAAQSSSVWEIAQDLPINSVIADAVKK